MDRKRILVADDVDSWRKIHKRHLKELGYEPVVVDSGEAASSALRSNLQFYGVVMDNNMYPGEDGIKILEQIRAGSYGEERKNIPILMVFSDGSRGSIESLVERHRAGFLNKDTLKVPDYRDKLKHVFGEPQTSV